MIVIERAEKKPGVFVGARMYRLVLNEQGLYILELGKAMGVRNKQNVLADMILDKIEEKRGQQHAEKTNELNSADLDLVVDNKKSFLVKKADVKEVKASQMDYYPKLKIKSGIVNITLYFSMEEVEKVKKIAAYLGDSNHL